MDSPGNDTDFSPEHENSQEVKRVLTSHRVVNIEQQTTSFWLTQSRNFRVAINLFFLNLEQILQSSKPPLLCQPRADAIEQQTTSFWSTQSKYSRVASHHFFVNLEQILQSSKPPHFFLSTQSSNYKVAIHHFFCQPRADNIEQQATTTLSTQSK